MTTSVMYKVISGNATAEEQSALQQWMEADEENREEFENVKLFYEAGEEHEAWQNIPEESAEPLLVAIRQDIRSRRQRKNILVGSFASFVLFVSLTLSFFLSGSANEKQYLRFERSSLAEVIPVLEEQYHIIVEVADPATLLCPFTGTFYSDSPATIIHTLTLGGSYSNTSDKIFVINGSGCSE